jgi:hypothetical protein
LKDRKTAAPKNNYFHFPLFFSKIALMQKINNYECCRRSREIFAKYFLKNMLPAKFFTQNYF